MTKTIVILGAGLAGLPVAHYLLSHTASTVSDIRVVLVNPSDEFYWNLSSVRHVIPGQISDDKYFWSIPELFAKYPSEKFEFLHGKAESLSPETNSVVVALNNGSSRTVDYHSIVIASGSTDKANMPWKPLGNGKETRAALEKLQNDIKNAKSIVVGGAGSTGVEFAGELGSEYSKLGKKSVTLIAADSLPLESRIMERTRKAARDQLESLKVKVITESKITNISQSGGQQVLEITKKDGSKTTIKTDLFVPTYGMVMNSQFAPSSMLDASGSFSQDTFLRSPGHKNVFILGDAGNLQPMQAVNVESQLRHLTKGFASYLQTGKVEEYKVADKVMLGVSIGRDGGTGQFGSMKPFSFIIWYFKCRYLGTDYAHEYAAGLRTIGGKW